MMIAKNFSKYLHWRPRCSILNFWPLGAFSEEYLVKESQNKLWEVSRWYIRKTNIQE